MPTSRGRVRVARVGVARQTLWEERSAGTRETEREREREREVAELVGRRTMRRTESRWNRSRGGV